MHVNRYVEDFSKDLAGQEKSWRDQQGWTLEVAAVRDLFHGAGETVDYKCAGHMFCFQTFLMYICIVYFVDALPSKPGGHPSANNPDLVACRKLCKSQAELCLVEKCLPGFLTQLNQSTPM